MEYFFYFHRCQYFVSPSVVILASWRWPWSITRWELPISILAHTSLPAAFWETRLDKLQIISIILYWNIYRTLSTLNSILIMLFINLFMNLISLTVWFCCDLLKCFALYLCYVKHAWSINYYNTIQQDGKCEHFPSFI